MHNCQSQNWATWERTVGVGCSNIFVSESDFLFSATQNQTQYPVYGENSGRSKRSQSETAAARLLNSAISELSA